MSLSLSCNTNNCSNLLNSGRRQQQQSGVLSPIQPSQGGIHNKWSSVYAPFSPPSSPLSGDNMSASVSAVMTNFNFPSPPTASPPPPSSDSFPLPKTTDSTPAAFAPSFSSKAGSPLAASSDFLSSHGCRYFGGSPNIMTNSGLSLLAVESPLLMPMGSPSSATPSTQQLSSTLRQRIMKTKLCVHHLHGRCARGINCAFAHSVNELRRPPNLYKTRLCINFSNNGSCPKGDLCRFAHGDFELRAGEHSSDESTKMSSGLHTGSSSPCIGSPTLLSSTTPASVLSPATPHIEHDKPGAMSSDRPGDRERLLEADAIDVLLKLPEETRQQVVDLVVRTVAATQGFDKIRGCTSASSWNRRSTHSCDLHVNGPPRRKSSCSVSSSDSSVRVRSRSGLPFASPNLNPLQEDDRSLLAGACGAHGPNLGGYLMGMDLPCGLREDQDSYGVDPYSAAMMLYGQMPSLPPLALSPSCEEDSLRNGDISEAPFLGENINCLPQLNVMSPGSGDDASAEETRCGNDAVCKESFRSFSLFSPPPRTSSVDEVARQQKGGPDAFASMITPSEDAAIEEFIQTLRRLNLRENDEIKCGGLF